MALTKTPVTGMKDIMPAEMEIRDYLIGLIKETYKSFGFTPIETPAMESIQNLTAKQGGDNEKLIFKVMKRGEKLDLAAAKTADDLADCGMRYDLTVPLVRFYANHANDLPKPFKALQVGPVWRADRPQRGRFRQFYQCDIDILGEPSNMAETELLLATSSVLGKIGFEGFRIHINDRALLKAMAAWSGFAEEDFDGVFITLDKMDKIGRDGVREELAANGHPEEHIERYLSLFAAMDYSEDSLAEAARVLAGGDCRKEADTDVSSETGALDMSSGLKAIENIREIMDNVRACVTVPCELVFDPTLVRGMSYYTGTIFEVEIAGLASSCGGGGRYDAMVGKFTNMQTPACGISLGFERLITILLEQGFTVPGAADKTAFLLDKKISGEKLAQILGEAQRMRAEGRTVLVDRMAKNKKHQKEQLTADGYSDIREIYAD